MLLLDIGAMLKHLGARRPGFEDDDPSSASPLALAREMAGHLGIAPSVPVIVPFTGAIQRAGTILSRGLTT